MKYVKQTFDLLSRGGFLSSDSISAETKNLFKDVEDNIDEYRHYFAQIGFVLEEGDGYFYFSRKDQRVQLVDKLLRFGHWVDVLDFLKSWEPAFGPGFSFSKAALTVKIDADIELKEKASSLYEKKDRHDDIVEKLVDEMTKMGFIELADTPTQTYRVVAAYRYLEDIVEMITIDNDSDETAQ